MVFWGVEVKPGKPFRQIPSEGFGSQLHLSQATLGLNPKAKERVTVAAKTGDGPEILLCSLTGGATEACPLDLIFEQDVVFSVAGSTSVHLTGYYMPTHEEHEFDDEEDEDDDEDEEEEEALMNPELWEDEMDEDDEDGESEEEDEDGFLVSRPHNSGVTITEMEDDEPSTTQPKTTEAAGRASAKAAGKKKEKKAAEVAAAPEAKEKEKVPAAASEKSGKKAKKLEVQKSAAVSDEAENGSKKREAEPAHTPAKKKPALTSQEGTPTAAAAAAATPDAESAPSKKAAKVAKAAAVAAAPATPKSAPAAKAAPEKTPPAGGEKKAKVAVEAVRKFPNGLEVHTLALGKPDGKQAKAGKKIFMHYTGKLKSNNKQFDSSIGKKPFGFRLGVGEVIKGWDIGVQGMRVGDKRRLVIPPAMGYGAKGAPGAIPPNAWLLFDIELVDVK